MKMNSYWKNLLEWHKRSLSYEFTRDRACSGSRPVFSWIQVVENRLFCDPVLIPVPVFSLDPEQENTEQEKFPKQIQKTGTGFLNFTPGSRKNRLCFFFFQYSLLKIKRFFIKILIFFKNLKQKFKKILLQDFIHSIYFNHTE